MAHDHVRSMVCEVENGVSHIPNTEKFAITSSSEDKSQREQRRDADQLYKSVSAGVKV